MKFAVVKEHRDFFHKEGMIEFTDFLTLDQVGRLNQAINEGIGIRTGTTPERWRHLNSEQLFLNGRDLWRTHESLRKWACLPRFAEIAAELVEKKPIRLGYDQLFPAFHQTNLTQTPKVYHSFIEQSVTLEEISGLKGIVCGLMICLADSDDQENLIEKESGLDIFPSRPGNVIFFLPQTSFNLRQLMHHVGQRYYLIVYTQQMAFYHLQPRDPHAHALKHLGQLFNDKLSDKLNPIIYR